MRLKASKEAIDFSRIFREHGYDLYLVGGAVRDYLLGKESHDYDFTTSAEPAEVKAMFRRTIDTGIKHGTVTVLYKGQQFEVTTFRADGDYLDSRHPESVSFVKSLEEDLRRRDFTINAFAAELPEGRIIDLNGGREDLKRKLIRAIGDPERRFTEDALRMMRACRFSAQLGFRIEERTEEAMAGLAPTIANVSAERIKEELFRLIASDNPRLGLEAMRRTGLLRMILPELDACYGFEQGGIHDETLYEHLLRALEACVRFSYPMAVRLAALFHDIGKVSTRAEGSGRKWTFYQHESVSAEMADRIFRRLKCSNEERESAVHLELRIADAAATGDGNVDISSVLALSERINAELDKANALAIKDLKVNGKDLMALGIPSGPMIGRILSELLEEVIEDPARNDRGYLEERALTLSRCPAR